MSRAVGYDDKWKRDIGSGVPSICDHPDCAKEIDRGLSYVCGEEPYGGDVGCGLYFCDDHMFCTDDGIRVCERCATEADSFEPTLDTQEWTYWKLTDESWQQWRDENPEEVAELIRW